MERLSVAAGEA